MFDAAMVRSPPPRMAFMAGPMRLDMITIMAMTTSSSRRLKAREQGDAEKGGCMEGERLLRMRTGAPSQSGSELCLGSEVATEKLTRRRGPWEIVRFMGRT